MTPPPGAVDLVATRRALALDPIYEVVPMNSLEAKLPELPPGSRVSVTCSPIKGIDATIDLCEHLSEAGYRVIPHLAARMVESHAHIDRVVERLAAASINRAFVIAGDAETPLGPIADSVELIRILAAIGSLDAIGFAAYPDGHAFINGAAIDAALMAKVELLEAHGIDGAMSTQMCFDPSKIASWTSAVRARGVDLPVHLGVPGSVERAKLITMGMRLGVGTSIRYLRKNRAGLGSLLGTKTYDPSQLVDPLLPRVGELGIEALHLFTFNQIAATATWQERIIQETAPVTA